LYYVSSIWVQLKPYIVFAVDSVTSGSHVTTTKKKVGHAQNLLPVRTTSGHVTGVTSVQKGPTRVDMAQLPVAHAQNILPGQ
jgi:hypothetical protein